MGNDIALAQAQASALEAAQKLVGGLRRTVDEAPSGGGDYLRFGKDGQWVFGLDAKAVDSAHDTALMNALSVQAGFVCWSDYPKEEKKKNTKLGERMAPVSNPIDPSSLPEHGWAWTPQQSVEFKFIEGPHAGKQVKFVTSSMGGMERLAGLIDLVIERVSAGSPFFFPVVLFTGDHYQHPSYGKTYKPVFDVVGWADVNGNEEPEDAPKAVEAKPAKKPAKEPVQTTVAPPVEEEPQPETDDPQPRRRRRG